MSSLVRDNAQIVCRDGKQQLSFSNMNDPLKCKVSILASKICMQKIRRSPFVWNCWDRQLLVCESAHLIHMTAGNSSVDLPQIQGKLLNW